MVKLQKHVVSVVVNTLDGIDNSEKLLNLSQILVLSVGSAAGLFHPGLGLLNHFSDILWKKWASQGVEIGWGCSNKGGGVWRSTNWNKLILVVFEEHLNAAGTFSLWGSVLDEVLTIIMIINFTWNFSTILGGDLYLELITARASVLTFIVTGLDNELNWLSTCLLLEDTWTEAK